jgi:molybdopterin-guanine dinucleotide biosynthesis protein B
MSIPIVSIVGTSGSGKTILLEKLIPELVCRGYRVATVKHSTHDFDIDQKGKDTWRHKRAGAFMTVISSPKRIALVSDVDKDHSVEEIRDLYIQGVDIILSEGYKGNPYRKIEVYRSGLKRKLLCGKEDNLLAVVSDVKVDAGVPCLDTNDAAGIVDLIENTFLKKS